MKIWLQSNGAILFKVNPGCYIRVNPIQFYRLGRFNKRYKIKDLELFTLASSFSNDYPQDFTSIYYTEGEEIRYWHELRELIKAVCI